MEKQLLQESIRYINVIFDTNGKKLEINRSRLLSLVTTTTTQGKCVDFINKVREDRFNKIKQKQISKFNRLISKTCNQDTGTSTSSSNYSNQSQTSRGQFNYSNQLQRSSGQANQDISSNNNNKWVANLSQTPLTPAPYSVFK